MKDTSKTNQELIAEISVLKKRIQELENSEAERKRVGEALQENEEFFRSYLEYAPDGVYMSDVKGNFLYGNRKCEEIIGYKREDLIGKNFLELNILPEKSLNKAAQLLQANIEGKPTGPDEIELISKEGRIIPVEISTSVVQRMGQRIILAFVRDISDRKRTVDALRESEEKYRWVLNNMADVITVMDMNLRFTYVSPSIIRMRGYTAEEVMAQTFEEVMTPESLQISAKVFEEEMKLEADGTADPERIRIVEVEQYRKDGSIILMENHLSFMRDEAKKAVGIISVSSDVTARKQAEDKIKKQTDAMESAIDGIAILNKDEEYTYLNQAHAKIYGYENAGELIGKSWRTLYNADEIKRFDAEIMPKFSKEGYWQGEALGMKKDGSKFPQEISLTALDDGGLICVARDITERKASEEALKKANETLDAIINSSPLAIIALDPDGNVTRWNPAAEQMFGWVESEVLGQFPPIVSEDKRGEHLKIRKSVLQGEAFTNIEVRRRKKNGSHIDISISIAPMRDSQGRVTGIISVSADITARKQVEVELKESKALTEAVVENVPLMIFLKEATDLRFLIFNRAGEELLGYDRRDLMGKNNLDLFPPEQAAHFMAKDREVLDGEAGMVDIPEEPILTARKGQRLLHTRKVCIRGSDGATKFLLGISEDITERKRAEEELRESVEKYRNILESIEEGYFEVDLAGNFTFFNPSLCRILGYPSEEMPGMNNRVFMDAENAKKIFRAFNEVYVTGIPRKGFEWETIRKDGSKTHIEVSVSLIARPGEKPIGFRGIARDVTERKLAEEAQREIEERFRLFVQNAPEAIFVQTEGCFAYLNPAALRLFGADLPDQLLGCSVFDRFHPDFHDTVEQRIRQLNIERLDVPPVEQKCLKCDGTSFDVEVSAVPLTYEGHNGALVFFHDISDRKRAEQQHQDTLDSLRKAVGTTIQVMVSAVEARDPYTSGHQLRSADLARAIATEMGLSQDKIEAIRMAGSIHDIGKISIPAEILSKPTKLSDIEFSLIKEHALRGFEMLKDVESPWPLAEIVHQHHERMDGSGYPRNLKGEEILIEARILSVADVVEAMASHRPYRPAIGIDAALEEIEKNSGTLYDNTVADACLRLFREKGFQLEGT